MKKTWSCDLWKSGVGNGRQEGYTSHQTWEGRHHWWQRRGRSPYEVFGILLSSGTGLCLWVNFPLLYPGFLNSHKHCGLLQVTILWFCKRVGLHGLWFSCTNVAIYICEVSHLVTGWYCEERNFMAMFITLCDCRWGSVHFQSKNNSKDKKQALKKMIEAPGTCRCWKK